MKEHKVYHIHVDGSLDLKQGYIGVTSNLKSRIRKHRFTGMLSDEDVVSVLCVGSEKYCFDLEFKLRAECHMGRNKSYGGKAGCTSIQVGQHLSKDTEIKPKQHLSKQTEFKKGTAPHNKGNGKDYLFTNPDGEEFIVTCISDFCKAHNLTPSNMRKVAKGERTFHKHWKASIITGR
jgi:hypothetical protein